MKSGCPLHANVPSAEKHDCEICGKTTMGCAAFVAHQCQPKLYSGTAARIAKDLSLGESLVYLAELEAEYSEQRAADRAMAM